MHLDNRWITVEVGSTGHAIHGLAAYLTDGPVLTHGLVGLMLIGLAGLVMFAKRRRCLYATTAAARWSDVGQDMVRSTGHVNLGEPVYTSSVQDMNGIL